jgi:hypothetical protein
MTPGCWTSFSRPDSSLKFPPIPHRTPTGLLPPHTGTAARAKPDDEQVRRWSVGCGEAQAPANLEVLEFPQPLSSQTVLIVV